MSVILYAKVLTGHQQGSQMDLSINPVSFPNGFYFPIIGPEPEVPRLPGAHILLGRFGLDIRPLTDNWSPAEMTDASSAKASMRVTISTIETWAPRGCPSRRENRYLSGHSIRYTVARQRIMQHLVLQRDHSRDMRCSSNKVIFQREICLDWYRTVDIQQDFLWSSKLSLRNDIWKLFLSSLSWKHLDVDINF